MDQPVAYDGGNPIERSDVAVAQAIATSSEAPSPDHFEHQAHATLSQWAATRRALERANQMIDELRAAQAEADARIAELVRANAQLSANLADSLAREGEAKEQAGWLKGIMTSAAGTLMDGLAQRTRTQSFDETDLRQIARGGQ